MNFHIRIIVLALSAIMLVSLVGCEHHAGALTPEAAFENLKAATKAHDYKAAFNQMTPDTQDVMLEGIVSRIGATSISDPPNGAQIEKIAQKYGLKKIDTTTLEHSSDPQTILKKNVVDVKDKPACFAEIVEWYATNRPNEPRPTFGIESIGTSAMSDVKINGDTALGMVKENDAQQESSWPIQFKRIGGRWYFDIDVTRPTGTVQLYPTRTK